ncbi:hypothetical protein LXM25_03510 [Dyadobacter sp. LJ53]|uniref:hypothetical protein n=1 Tax=Dyadobacter chenwenxiniae TaxID=2906456 RepID=UPI001F2D0D4B|nr:hypothetical protein [Dyadobacter chenwenxiniae]MCF0049111.1 hypothetical protein [Dyadobacter chenwenxiniae]
MASILLPVSSNSFEDVGTKTNSIYYAVYDCCVTNQVPSRDVAFIEQRLGAGNQHEAVANDEKYFRSLREAKAYVNRHFKSGAEYFSLNQSSNPDNIFYTIIDKISYLIA